MIRIVRWFETKKANSTLLGKLTLIDDNLGIEFRKVCVFKSGGIRWVSPPAEEFVGRDGKKAYASYWKWCDRKQGEAWQREVLDALDEHNGVASTSNSDLPPDCPF